MAPKAKPAMASKKAAQGTEKIPPKAAKQGAMPMKKTAAKKK